MMFSMAAVEIVDEEDLDFLLPFLHLVPFIFLPLPVEIFDTFYINAIHNHLKFVSIFPYT